MSLDWEVVAVAVVARRPDREAQDQDREAQRRTAKAAEHSGGFRRWPPLFLFSFAVGNWGSRCVAFCYCFLLVLLFFFLPFPSFRLNFFAIPCRVARGRSRSELRCWTASSDQCRRQPGTVPGLSESSESAYSLTRIRGLRASTTRGFASRYTPHGMMEDGDGLLALERITRPLRATIFGGQ